MARGTAVAAGALTYDGAIVRTGCQNVVSSDEATVGAAGACSTSSTSDRAARPAASVRRNELRSERAFDTGAVRVRCGARRCCSMRTCVRASRRKPLIKRNGTTITTVPKPRRPPINPPTCSTPSPARTRRRRAAAESGIRTCVPAFTARLVLICRWADCSMSSWWDMPSDDMARLKRSTCLPSLN